MHLVGGELEGGPADLLLRDVRNQAGALPLLQHALLELWHKRAELSEQREKEQKEAARKLRRRAVIAAGAAAAALLLLVIAAVMWLRAQEQARIAAIQRNAAEEQARRAEEQTRIAESRRLAAESSSALAKYPQRSVLLAVEAVKVEQPIHGVRVAADEQSLREALVS